MVDDNGFNVICLKAMLKRYDLNSHTASNGEEALDIIDKKLKAKPCGVSCQKGYSLIFMDCNMPIMDGYETTRIIRRTFSLKMTFH